MRKLYWVDPQNPPLDSPPHDPFDVKEAIQDGKVAPIGSYLRHDVPMILKLIADRFEPRGDESPDQSGKTDHDPTDDQSQSGPNDDWDSNTLDVLQCIEDGKAAPVGWYLRDLADLLSDLGPVFDPEAASQDWKLIFKRRRRGPPRDILKEMYEARLVRFAVMRARGKKEAGVHELVEKGVMSRAKAFRRTPKKRESHKNPK